jgi:hypothetical protein
MWAEPPANSARAASVRSLAEGTTGATFGH